MKPALRLRWVPVAALAAASLTLAGCGGDDESEAPKVETSPSAEAGPGATPGVSGTIASVTDGLLQVQDSEKQTAVAYSDDTDITDQVPGDQADVVVGSCVTAVGEEGAQDGSQEEEATDPFAAATVTLTPAEADGSCSGGPGGAAGGGFGGLGDTPSDLPSDFPTDGGRPGGGNDAPEGMPSDLPSDFPTDGGQGFGRMGSGNMASGTVTAVAGQTVTVEQSGLPGFGGQESDQEPASRSFTIGDAAITTTQFADQSALRVGKCVVAQGQADASGRIQAESLALSEPGETGCAAMGGFGARGGGPMAGGPGQDGSAADDASSRPGRPAAPEPTAAPAGARAEDGEPT